MIYQTNLENITPAMLEGFFDGWPSPPNPETHFKILESSYRFIVAIDDQTNQVAGFITAISDGVLSAYIPLLEVLPSYKNQGIGKELMKRMLVELQDIYMIDLMCDENLQTYYEQFGMIKANGMIVRNFKRQSGN